MMNKDVWLTVDVATTLTPLDRKTYLTGLRYYVDVFPEDLEKAAEMLAQK